MHNMDVLSYKNVVISLLSLLLIVQLPNAVETTANGEEGLYLVYEKVSGKQLVSVPHGYNSKDSHVILINTNVSKWVDPGFTDWETSGKCSVTCGPGWQQLLCELSLQRVCDNDITVHTNQCEGDGNMIVYVNEIKCHTIYPLPYTSIVCPDGRIYGSTCQFMFDNGTVLNCAANAECDKTGSVVPHGAWTFRDRQPYLEKVDPRIAVLFRVDINYLNYDGPCDETRDDIKNKFIEAFTAATAQTCQPPDRQVSLLQIICGDRTGSTDRKCRDATYGIQFEAEVEISGYQSSADKLKARSSIKNSLSTARESGNLNIEMYGTVNSPSAIKVSQLEGNCTVRSAYNNKTLEYDMLCKAGYYRDTSRSRQNSCTHCPAGTTTKTKGAHSVSQCEEACQAGFYSATGTPPCSACDLGWFSENYGYTECTQCQGYKIMLTAGATPGPQCKDTSKLIPKPDQMKSKYLGIGTDLEQIVENNNKKHVVPNNFLPCGNDYFDPDNKRTQVDCCNGVVNHARPGMNVTCCGTEFIDTDLYQCCNDVKIGATKLCCGNQIYERTSGLVCCGTKLINNTYLCCEPQSSIIIPVKKKPEHNRCCGNQTFYYDPNEKDECCGGMIIKLEQNQVCKNDHIVTAADPEEVKDQIEKLPSVMLPGETLPKRIVRHACSFCTTYSDQLKQCVKKFDSGIVLIRTNATHLSMEDANSEISLIRKNITLLPQLELQHKNVFGYSIEDANFEISLIKNNITPLSQLELQHQNFLGFSMEDAGLTDMLLCILCIDFIMVTKGLLKILNRCSSNGKRCFKLLTSRKRNQFKSSEKHSIAATDVATMADTKRTLCKVCWDEEMCVMFLPCCHLATCESCADRLHCCVVCRALIEGSFTVTML